MSTTPESIFVSTSLEQTLGSLGINAKDAIQVARASYGLRLVISLIAAHYPTVPLSHSLTNAVLLSMQEQPLSQVMESLLGKTERQQDILANLKVPKGQETDEPRWSTISSGTVNEHLTTLRNLKIISTDPDESGRYMNPQIQAAIIRIGSKLLRWHATNRDFPSKLLWGRINNASEDNVARRLGILATIAMHHAPESDATLEIPISEFVSAVGVDPSRMHEDFRLFEHSLGLLTRNVIPRNTPANTFICPRPNELPTDVFREGTQKNRIARALKQAFTTYQEQGHTTPLTITELLEGIQIAAPSIGPITSADAYRVLNDWQEKLILQGNNELLQKITRENTYIVITPEQHQWAVNFLHNFQEDTESTSDPCEDPSIVSRYLSFAEKSVNTINRKALLIQVLTTLLLRIDQPLTQTDIYEQLKEDHEYLTLVACGDVLAQAEKDGLVHKQTRRTSGATKFYQANLVDIVEILASNEESLKTTLKTLHQIDTTDTAFAQLITTLLEQHFKAIIHSDTLLRYALQITHSKPAYQQLFQQLLQKAQERLARNKEKIGKDPQATLLAIAVFGINGGAFADNNAYISIGFDRFMTLLQQRFPSQYLLFSTQLASSPLMVIKARTLIPSALQQQVIYVSKGFTNVNLIQVRQQTKYYINGQENTILPELIKIAEQLLRKSYQESGETLPTPEKITDLVWNAIGIKSA